MLYIDINIIPKIIKKFLNNNIFGFVVFVIEFEYKFTRTLKHITKFIDKSIWLNLFLSPYSK